MFQGGKQLRLLNWQRPGFELAMMLRRVVQENPHCDGVVLGGHGLSHADVNAERILGAAPGQRASRPEPGPRTNTSTCRVFGLS